MPVHKWRRRATKHFGEVWVPYVQVEFAAQGGSLQTIALQIDSGATVSLLRRSVADLLGLDINAGHKIDLSSVGNAEITAFVHELPTRLAPEVPQIIIPFAIAEAETVPNLLGRVGVFDSLQVDFDPSLEETRITGRWLDDGDRKVWDYLVETQAHIYKRVQNSGWTPEIKEAVRRLLNRGDLLLATMSRAIAP